MGDQVISGVVSIAAAVIGLAALSVILSRNAATAQVIEASTTGLSKLIGVAVSPVSAGGRLGSIGSGNVISGGINFP